MLPIVHRLKNLKKQYALFITTMVLTIAGSQLLIQYGLSKQNEDAQLINLAGSQPMLSQRIAKLVLYINDDIQSSTGAQAARLDTLSKLISRWERVHATLLNGNSEYNISGTRSPDITSLLNQIGDPLKKIVKSCRDLVKQPDKDNSAATATVIEQNELQVLRLMQATANRFQVEAEQKLTDIKNIEIGLATAAVILLFLEFLYLVLPIIKRIEEQNLALAGLNNQLGASNEELQASEEELKTNIEYITTLQEELTAREKQYRELVENATDMIFEVDGNGSVVFTNRVMHIILGYSDEELRGRKYSELLDPSHMAAAMEFYQEQVRQQKGRSSYEVRVITKSGRPIWLEQNALMTFDHGKLQKVRVIGRDVSKRKEAEAALRLSEQRFRTLAENAPIGIFQTDPNGQCTFVNKHWCSVAGMDQSEALGGGWGNAVHPLDRDVVFSAWNESLNSGSEFELEFKFHNPQLGTRLVYTRANRVAVDGEILGFIGAMNDVTELREAQKKLAESEKLYRELSENSEDFVSINTPQHQFIYVSSSAPRVLGFESEALVGGSYKDLIFGDDLRLFEQSVTQSSLVKSVQHIEHRLRNLQGDYIWMDTHIQPIFDTHGRFTSYQLTSRDITTRKEIQLALQEAKLKAEDATNAKSHFLSMMSHEIRTPMNAIIGLTNILIQEQPRDDQKESLRLLKFSGENLLTIINDILDFSKIEAGKITLEQIDVDVRQLMQDILHVMEGRAREKGIELRFKFESDAGIVFKTDSVRLGQVVTNLVGNAIKFTEHGSVELAISVKQQETSIASVHVAIVDTGIGIAADKLEVIFDSFSQASADTTRKFGGTGLGLSITRRLIELMGSVIKVTSTPGKGSVFSFELMLAPGDERNTIQQTSHRKAELAHAKILLVEDNRVNQIVATNFLKKWGLTVDIANNGVEALSRIESKEYALVLMDLQMPEMDGYTAARRIREKQADPYFQRVPIIALTASAMMDVRGKVLQTGMNDFITKPFEPDDLYQKISAYMLDIAPKKSESRINHTNLDIYTEGDPDFKRELASHLVKNIQELEEALDESLLTNNPECFGKAVHKVKTTVGMLGDQEFTRIIDELKTMINLSQRPDAKRLDTFRGIARELIDGLSEEINAL